MQGIPHMYSKYGHNLAVRSNEEKGQYRSVYKYTNCRSQHGHGNRNQENEHHIPPGKGLQIPVMPPNTPPHTKIRNKATDLWIQWR